MAKRANRRQRSRESNAVQKRRSITRIKWAGGLAVILLGLVIGGVFYSRPLNSDQVSLTTDSGVDVGSDVGDLVPGFDLRLFNGSTINSTALVSAEKPVFYFFFATW